MEFLGIPYKSLSFPGNDGPNKGQNDEQLMTKMMKNEELILFNFPASPHEILITAIDTWSTARLQFGKHDGWN